MKCGFGAGWKAILSLRHKVENERSLMATIRERQLKSIGHIFRGDWLLRTIVDGRMNGRERHQDL